MALKARQTCLGSEARVGGRQKSNSDGVLGKQRSYAGGRKRTTGAKKQSKAAGAPMKQPQAAGRRQCLVGEWPGGRSSIRRRQGAVDSLVLWGRQGTSSSRDSGQGAAHTQQERGGGGGWKAWVWVCSQRAAAAQGCRPQLLPCPVRQAHGTKQSRTAPQVQIQKTPLTTSSMRLPSSTFSSSSGRSSSAAQGEDCSTQWTCYAMQGIDSEQRGAAR